MKDKHHAGHIFAGDKKYIINTCIYMESIYNTTDIQHTKI